MIKALESASNSTQLTQIALDDILREFAEVSRLPLARLQKSISNQASPIRQMYTALLAYTKAEKLCQERADQLNTYKQTLRERKKQVQKLLLQNNDPSLEAAFRQEFQTSTALEKEIEALAYQLSRVHNKCNVLNKLRRGRIQQYLHQYEVSRMSLRKALNDKGYQSFSDSDLDDAFANVCHINNESGVSHG